MIYPRPVLKLGFEEIWFNNIASADGLPAHHHATAPSATSVVTGSFVSSLVIYQLRQHVSRVCHVPVQFCAHRISSQTAESRGKMQKGHRQHSFFNQASRTEKETITRSAIVMFCYGLEKTDSIFHLTQKHANFPRLLVLKYFIVISLVIMKPSVESVTVYISYY